MKKTLAFILLLVSMLVASPIDNVYAAKQNCYVALGRCNSACEDIFSSMNPGRYGCYTGCALGWAFC